MPLSMTPIRTFDSPPAPSESAQPPTPPESDPKTIEELEMRIEALEKALKDRITFSDEDRRLVLVVLVALLVAWAVHVQRTN